MGSVVTEISEVGGLPPLDPVMRRILESIQPDGVPPTPLGEFEVHVLRARVRELFRQWNSGPSAVPLIREYVAVGAFGPARVRFYEPGATDSLRPALIYFHGGGWAIGDLDHEDASLQVLARESGVAIYSVDYVLAPEHRFPDAIQDCISVSGWIHSNAAQHGVDPARLALGGGSAGANLAVAAALGLRDAGDRWVRFLLLNCGVYSTDFGTRSHRAFGDGRYLLSTADMHYFLGQYLRSDAQRHDPRVAVVAAELAGLPRVLLVAAALDPLLDDSLLMHQRLLRAGVPSECRVYDGVVHGFPIFVQSLPTAARALSDMGSILRKALTG